MNKEEMHKLIDDISYLVVGQTEDEIRKSPAEWKLYNLLKDAGYVEFKGGLGAMIQHT